MHLASFPLIFVLCVCARAYACVHVFLYVVGAALIQWSCSFITKTRHENATTRRKAAWRLSASGGFTGEDVHRRDKENQARNDRLAIRLYETERGRLPDVPRSFRG